MTSAFDSASKPLLEAVSSGLSLEEACQTVGIAENTVRGWLRKGRLSPEGRYGRFATALLDSQAQRAAPPVGVMMQLIESEWEGLVANLARQGSVAALKLWADRHPADAKKASADPFGRFDELAQRRGRAA